MSEALLGLCFSFVVFLFPAKQQKHQPQPLTLNFDLLLRLSEAEIK